VIRRLLRVDPYGNLFHHRTRERLKKLLSPRWLARRVAASAWAVRNPDAPWLARQSLEELERCLTPQSVVFEWGSGLSTPWLAARAGKVTSIEHDPGWHRKVTKLVPANAEVRLVPESTYLMQAEAVPDASLDVVLVDGLWAGKAICASLPKLRRGGVLVVNRAQTLLPSDSDRPGARSREDGPDESIEPRSFLALQRWRTKWVTDGLDDVAFFWKP
jgi:predicted O-methyltransferase YrrM